MEMRGQMVAQLGGIKAEVEAFMLLKLDLIVKS